MKNIRILIVDDSALIRKMLSQIFNSCHEIEVVGTAADPFLAREKIKKLNPDVLTLDVEMPRMDGLTFLANLMRLRPMPVVMISALTEKGADVTLKALELGAVDFIAKPKLDVTHGLNEYADEIIEKVKGAAVAHIRSLDEGFRKQDLEVAERSSADAVLKTDNRKDHYKTTDKIVAIGASTGGTEAIKEVVRGLGATTPAIVISQHLPAAFSESFARHVDQVSQMSACVASDGQAILPGTIYIAPGDKHLLVVRSGARWLCQLDDGPPVNRHKPSVDVMFRSVARHAGPNALSVMLTGMGADGAKGMKEMHEAGSSTIIQDEASSVVWGMPGEAFKLGCVDYVMPLNRITEKILTLLTSVGH